MSKDITWDVLITTIPHRHAQLRGLLAEFDRQWQPEFGAIVYQTRALADSGDSEARYARKLQVLLEASKAGWVCFVDDDDHVAPDYVEQIVNSLKRSRPDYVGFPVHYTVDGVPQQKVSHSLQYGGWSNHPDILLRDISHLNPIRRELALQARFDTFPDHGADGNWAAALRQLGVVKTEEYISAPMYHYDFRSGGSFLNRREPWTQRLPERPEYPWLRWIGE